LLVTKLFVDDQQLDLLQPGLPVVPSVSAPSAPRPDAAHLTETEPLRIAYLVGTYPSVSHTAIYREVTALREIGVEVHTFSVHRPSPEQLLSAGDRREARNTPSIQPPSPTAVIGAHLRALSFSPVRYFQTLGRALRLSPGGARATLWHFFYFAEAIMLWDWLRRRRLVHVHVHFAFAATAIALLYGHFGEPQGCTWSFTMHGPTEFDNVRPFRLAEKVAAASFVACISDFARSQLMKLVPSEHWHKLAVVRCGVDTTQFRASAERSVQEDDRLTILSIGRLVPDKGHGVLLSALSSLPSNATTRLRLVIAGDGPERAPLERAAARLSPDLVTFLGAVGQDRLVSLYQQADMFCLPSFAEGLPGVLMEAMAMGLPVIATRIMGIPEIVEDGVSGRLVAPGRADALAGALLELLADPELRSSMGKAGRRRVEQEYDIRRSASALAQLYRASLGTPQARNAY